MAVSQQTAGDKCPHCQKTLAHPDELDENLSHSQIYRRHRRVHFAWGDVPEGEEGTYLSGDSGTDFDDSVPEDCKLDTQTYEVDFHMEVVETVVVEAPNESMAKERAQHYREYTGEYKQTIHTDMTPWGEPSQASIKYLETTGLLPEDHDVTEEQMGNEWTGFEEEDIGAWCDTCSWPLQRKREKVVYK